MKEYKKLNVVMYVDTYKQLREYSQRTGLSMIKVIIKALNYSLRHKKKFKEFVEEYKDIMEGEITTVRTFSVKEKTYLKIKEVAEKLGYSISLWVDSAVTFYLNE